MGCEFFKCDNCNECSCDFIQCSICNENDEMICSSCIENDNENMYNVIYCKMAINEYGNLDYCFICDYCLKKFHNEKIVSGLSIEEHFKKNFDIEFLDGAIKSINNYKEHITNKIKKEILLRQCQIEDLNKKLNNMS